MSISGSGQYHLLDQLAEEFAARFRRGERPSLKEYTDRYPELADEIRELFPALVEVEQVERFQHGGEVTGEAPASTPPLSQVGDYRVLREIGRGGMGVVYEAEQISLGRRVALKVLPRHASGNRMIEERFRREARAAARLHHTNIVPVFEVGHEEDIRFYAMQFIQGQSLDLVIGELRRLRERVRSVSKPGSAALDGWHGQPLGEHLSPAVAEPTLGEGAELSQVVHSVLTGQFNPGGPPSGPVGASPSGLKRAIAGAIAPVTGTGEYTDPGPAWARTESLGTAEVDAAGPTVSPSPGVAPSSSACPSTSSASLPGGAQLSSVEAGRRAFYRSLAHIGRQVAGALAHAHARGIVHRDIKPSNLLLDTDGVAWITDFGLAKGDEEGLTQSGDILGTLRYMAPERFRGEGDARSDVYALGMTLYELLTLRSGFEATDRLRLIEQIKSEEPARPRTVDPRIPRDLETIVLKAIEKDPRARYPTAEAMSEDLGRFLADEPIKARQVSSAERYWRWARRNPVIAILGGVLTAVLVATTLGSLVVASHFRRLANSEAGANERSQGDRKEAVEARRQAIAERDNSRRLSANLTFEKGVALAEQGQADRGLHWMLEALRTAPAEPAEFGLMVRRNLSAWLGQVPRPLKFLDTGRDSKAAVFSPDGSEFATYEAPLDVSSQRAFLWQLASGRELATYPDIFGLVSFSPDGRVLFAVSGDGKRMVALDRATGKTLWSSPKVQPRWNHVDLSRDGTIVRCFCESFAQSWDALTGQPIGEPTPPPRVLITPPDDRFRATATQREGQLTISLADARSGSPIVSWDAIDPQAYRIYVTINPDRRSLVELAEIGIGLGSRMTGQLRELKSGKPIGPLMGRVNRRLFTPAGDRFLGDTNSFFLIRDTATGQVRGSSLPRGGAVHPDGKLILSDGGRWRLLYEIPYDAERVASAAGPGKASWDTVQASPTALVRDYRLFRAGLRADVRVAARVGRGPGDREVILLADPTTGRPIGRPAVHRSGWEVFALTFSPDGRTFATGSHPPRVTGGEVRLWDTETGRLRCPPMLHTNWVAALAFQPDGKTLAAGDYSGLVRFWDTSTGREVGRPLRLGEIVLGLAYSPDGKTLAVGLTNDRTGKPGTQLWDVATRQPRSGILPVPPAVSMLEFRPDGRALLAGDITSRLYDAVRGEPIGELMVQEQSRGFSADGRMFLTVSKQGTVKLRDATTGAVIGMPMSFPSASVCAAFRGDGSLIAVGCEDGKVRLCDTATHQPVGPPHAMLHMVHRVGFTADGRTLVAVDEFGESRTWPVPEPIEETNLENLRLRIEARTGLRMEAGQSLAMLDDSALRERLEQLGRLDPAAVQPDTDPAWHEPMIREAERNGNAFAAVWHLDRLIAARPGDWYLYARRARAHSALDEFEKAAADYQQAERLSSRAQILDFQSHCVVDCTRAERWAEALWYLDRLIADRPDEWSLHADRAAVYGRLGREADRQAELAHVYAPGADAGLVLQRAEELGRAGRWQEAATLIAQCGRTNPLDHLLAQAWAVATLKAGDQSGYREACAAVLARNGPEPAVVWDEVNTASVLALGAGGLNDYRVAMAWFERRLSAVPAPPPFYRHFFSSMLGGLLLRAGRVDEAIARLNEGLAASKEPEIPNDWALLAIAHARKGEPAAARRWLDRLSGWRPDSSVTFWDLQEVAVLRDELEILLLGAAFPRDPFSSSGP